MLDLCVCFDLLFFFVTFNDFCTGKLCCGLLSRIKFNLIDQSWQNGPNESVMHFKVVFAVCWH